MTHQKGQAWEMRIDGQKCYYIHLMNYFQQLQGINYSYIFGQDF